MDVATITMEPAEAREKLREYEAGLRRRYDAEHALIRDGLSRLARGEALVDVGQAIRTAPLDDRGRPRLAIARADRRQVKFSWSSWDSTARFDASSHRATYTTDTLERVVDMGRRPERSVEGFALIPLVPPAGLRVIGGASYLRDHYVLWEVEQWADRRIQTEPDRDPYLLSHVGGELYAVLFEWDLTELERAVMAGRRNG